MDLKTHIRKTLEDVRAIAAKADAEGRDLTAEERADVIAKTEEARTLKAQLDDASAGKAALSFAQELAKTLGDDADRRVAKAVAGGTLGNRVVNAPAWQDWTKSVAGRLTSGKASIGQSPAIEFGGLKDIFGVKDAPEIVTGAGEDSAGALVRPDWLGLPDGMGPLMRELTLRQAVTTGTTTSDSVEYARQVAFENNAAPVPEASDLDPDAPDNDNTAGRKPRSAWETEVVKETVKTVAHWLPATKRALADAGQVRTLVDAFLRYGLEEELEVQILEGDGTGENFTGILETDGVQEQAFDTDLAVTFRKAITKVRTNGKARTTAIMVNPEDDERLDLMQDLEGRYYFGGPATSSTPSLWGRPRIVSEAMPEGKAIAADWRFAVLWDREQASVQAFDQHEDYAIRNLVALLAELRAAFGIIRPAAFVVVDTEGTS